VTPAPTKLFAHSSDKQHPKRFFAGDFQDGITRKSNERELRVRGEEDGYFYGKMKNLRIAHNLSES
jgi:hypothetical protein